MPERLPDPAIEWRDGHPHAADGRAIPARAECEARALTAHGFGTAGASAPGRWTAHANSPSPRWTIADATHSAGRNFLVTWAAFRAHALGHSDRAQLDWLGVENAPLDAATLLQTALADPGMADLAPLARELARVWPEQIPGMHRRALDNGRVRLTLLFGDAAAMLRNVTIAPDAWICDDGATAGGPASVAASASAAAPAPASVPPPPTARPLPAWFAQPQPSAARAAVVIGAGLAGAAAARALAERGLDVLILDTLGPAGGASGAPRAVLAPHIASWAGLQTRIVAHAFLHARGVLRRLNIPHEECGLLHPLAEDDVWAHEQALAEWGWPAGLLRVTSAAEAHALAGVPLGGRPPNTRAAVWTPLACVTQPTLTVRALLDHPAITVHAGAEVTALQQTPGGWKLLIESATASPALPAPPTHEFPLVVLATAGAWAPRRAADGTLTIDRTDPLASSALPDVPFDTTRGQLTMLAHPAAPFTPQAAAPHAIISANGFVMPPHSGTLCAGATYERGTNNLQPTTHDDALNVQALERLVPALYDEHAAPQRAGAWTGLRATVKDHCPVVGAVHDSAAFRPAFAPLCDGPFAAKWPAAPLLPGLFATLAHGSRGTSTALLAGELLADIMTGGVRCVPDDLLPALLPQRFLVRALRRSEGETVA